MVNIQIFVLSAVLLLLLFYYFIFFFVVVCVSVCAHSVYNIKVGMILGKIKPPKLYLVLSDIFTTIVHDIVHRLYRQNILNSELCC